MEVRLLGPLKVGSLLWQSPRGGWVLTVVAKATFDLLPGDARVAERQDEVHARDKAFEDGAGVFAPSDLAPFKPHVDVLVVGHAFAAREEPPRPIVARIVVGEVDKSLELGPEARIDGDPAAPQRLSLPRDVGGEIGAAEVGLGPVPETSRARRERLGRHAGAWSLTDLGERPLPEDIDPGFFNTSPRDQRLQVLREDATITLEHLHPGVPRLVTKLPSLRARAFAETAQGVADVRMAADTLWIDTDRGLGAVTWRGQVLLEAPTQAGAVFVTLEHVARPLTWADVAPLRASMKAPSAPPPAASQQPAASPSGTEPGMRSVAPSLRGDAAVPSGLPFVSAEVAPGVPSSQGAPPTQGTSRAPAVSSLGVTRPSVGVPVAVAPASPPVSAPRPHMTPQTQDVMTLSATVSSGKAPPWLAMYAAKNAAAREAAAQAAAGDTPASGPSGSDGVTAAVRRGTQPIDPGTVAAAAAAIGAAARSPSSIPPVRETIPHEAPTSVPQRVAAVAAPVAASPTLSPSSSTPGGAPVLELLAFDEREIARMAPWRSGDASADVEVRHALARALGSDGAGLARAAAAAIDEGAGYAAPIARVDGDLELDPDTLSWLRVLAATAAPFAAADGELREAAEACAAASADTPSALLTAMAEELEAALARAMQDARAGGGGHGALARRLADVDVAHVVEASIAAQRRWTRRVVFGDRVVSARIHVGGVVIPAYVGEALELRLPLARRLPVSVFAAVHERQDPAEPHALALRVLAIARRASPPVAS